jgi:hypothetical protein
MKGLFLGLSLLLMTSVPAAAQDTPGRLGVGLSFLSDDGGTGVTVDYSKPFRSLANNRTLGWVGDFSFHRNSEGIEDFEVDLTVLTFQGGVRIGGPFGQNPNLTWHGQGLVGILRTSASNDLLDDVCDVLDIDCSDSETDFVFTPGGGIDYAFNERTAFRAQIDFLISDGSAVRFWIGISQRIGQ